MELRKDKLNMTGKACKSVTLRRGRETIVGVEKQEVLHILIVSVVLIIQNAKRMRRIMLSFVACPALLRSSTLSHKRHNFRKRNY
jgi:hypothetical protein